MKNNWRKNQPWGPVAMLVNVGDSLLKDSPTRRILSFCSEHCFYCLCAIHKHHPTKTWIWWLTSAHSEPVYIVIYSAVCVQWNYNCHPSRPIAFVIKRWPAYAGPTTTYGGPLQGRSHDFEEGGATTTKEGAKATPLINDVIFNSWAWPNLLFA